MLKVFVFIYHPKRCFHVYCENRGAITFHQNILSDKMLERDKIKYLLVFVFVVTHAHVHLRENKG